MPNQQTSETEHATPPEVKQQVFELKNYIVGKLEVIETKCPTIAEILKSSMLQITPFEKAERSPDGSPTPRWDRANEKDLRILKGIDEAISMIYLKPKALKQMIIGIMQSCQIMETDYRRQDLNRAREISAVEEAVGPEGPVATIFQANSDQLLQAVYELDSLVGRKRTGTLLQ